MLCVLGQTILSRVMEQQEAIVEYYMSRLGDNIEETIQEAIRDPQLFVFCELLEAVEKLNSIWVGRLRTMAFGVIGESAPSWMNKDVLHKFRKLSLLTYVNVHGWSKLSLDHTCAYLHASSQLELIQLLLGMKPLMEVRIDERSGLWNVVDMHVFRDVDPRSVPALQEKLDRFIDRIDQLVL